jgi:hypothetical protein
MNTMRQNSQSAGAKKDIKTRQHLMERSFANATRFGFDQARWRGLWRMRIQELLVCTIQNIQMLIKKSWNPRKAAAVRAISLETAIKEQFSTSIPDIPRYFGIYWSCRLAFQRT